MNSALLSTLLKQDGERIRLERDFQAYVRAFWPLLNPSDPLDPDCWYVRLLCEWLQGVSEGQRRRLAVSLPPRSGKSTICSILWPTWTWTTHPETRWGFWSYEEGLATKFSVRRRDVITSPLYQKFWSDRVRLSSDENQKSFFSNTATGTMEVLVQATGSGSRYLVIDDPHSLRSLSDAEREANIEFVRSGLMTRLDRPADSPVVIVGQRVHPQDVIGVLLGTEGAQWEYVNLPAEVTERPETVVFPLSGRTMERPIGHLLDETRMPKSFLVQQQAIMGSVQFSAQYLGRPVPITGNVCRPEWFKFYDPDERDWRAIMDAVYISADLAFRKSETSSEVSLQVWGTRGRDCYLLDKSTMRRTYTETKASLRALADKWQTRQLILEMKASGDMVYDEMHNEFDIIRVEPTTEKMQRLSTASSSIQAGHVYLPDNAQGRDLQAKLCAAPMCLMDDVDSCSQFLNYFRDRGGNLDGWKAYADLMTTGRYSDGTRVGAGPSERYATLRDLEAAHAVAVRQEFAAPPGTLAAMRQAELIAKGEVVLKQPPVATAPPGTIAAEREAAVIRAWHRAAAAARGEPVIATPEPVNGPTVDEQNQAARELSGLKPRI